jgi:hypothetical protein
MDIRREFEKRIEKKRQEIADLERAIAEAKAYMQALMDALKILPKDAEDGVEEPLSALRSGSDLQLAAELIKTKGRPLHIDEILAGISKPVTKESKASLSTSLSAYARKSVIFTRPMPNTFGLITLDGEPGNQPSGSPEAEEPPF